MTNPQLASYLTWKAARISFKIRSMTRMPTLFTSIQQSFGSPSTVITEEKEMEIKAN